MAEEKKITSEEVLEAKEAVAETVTSDAAEAVQEPKETVKKDIKKSDKADSGAEKKAEAKKVEAEEKPEASAQPEANKEDSTEADTQKEDKPKPAAKETEVTSVAGQHIMLKRPTAFYTAMNRPPVVFLTNEIVAAGEPANGYLPVVASLNGIGAVSGYIRWNGGFKLCSWVRCST